MSRITDALDAATDGIDEVPRPVAAASGAVGATTSAVAALAASARALDVVLDALAGPAGAGAREVRIVAFDRTRGARSYRGPEAGLRASEPAWESPLEASFRGHEVFFPAGVGAEPMALALALTGELAPAGEEDEVEGLASCLSVARRALAERADLGSLLEPEALDALLDALEEEPRPEAPVGASGAFGIVAVDREGGVCAATAGDAPSTPVVALRFGRAFLGIAGPASDEALLLPLVRVVDRAAAPEALLEGLDPLGAGDLALVLREDTGELDARTDSRGKGAAAVQTSLGSTSAQA